MAGRSSDLDMGATVWMIASTALVFLMVPGLGYFYSGMVRSKNAVSLVFLCMMALAVVTVQWVGFGYSLALSETSGSGFIGNMQHWGFLDVGYAAHPNAATVPGIVFAVYQCMFAGLTPGLALGGAAERIRVLPVLVYTFVWTTVVYDPIAYWVWAPGGWLARLGVLDFAGGCAVETASGFAALAFYAVLGKRRGFGSEKFGPHNHLNILLGFAFLFFGWFGFNAGGASLTSGRAGIAFMTTNVAGAVAGIVWVALGFWQQRRFSSFHFCSGAVAGMVCVTPAASYVSTWAAVPMGCAAGVCCFYAVEASLRLGIDDCIDVFAVHGVGGVLGLLLTGVFADARVIGLDGTHAAGGAINGHARQLAIQLAAAAAAAAWSFGVSYAVLRAMDAVPVFRFRVDAAAEDHGLDFAELGEAGYSFMRDMATMHGAGGDRHKPLITAGSRADLHRPLIAAESPAGLLPVQHPHALSRPVLKGSPSSGTVAAD
ncbi:hypothetical protein GGI04_000520 [Coemansia thaxteri]|nr:hypothetical protein GGI04_000520 [Coemansia thaxteri]KAJ2474014.1 hypothetical protein GGI02_000419 [Coemansia sp. RSA 2322]